MITMKSKRLSRTHSNFYVLFFITHTYLCMHHAGRALIGRRVQLGDVPTALQPDAIERAPKRRLHHRFELRHVFLPGLIMCECVCASRCCV